MKNKNISFEKTAIKIGTAELEYRKDPLTNRICTVALGLREKIKLFLGETDESLIEKIAEETKKNCPFCPEAIDKLTPKLPREIFESDRLVFGEAVAFPNLFPRSEFEAVVVLSRKHYLKVDEFNSEIIANGLRASLAYINKVYEKTKIENAVIGCNYLFPAGASAIHPHIQACVRSLPYSFLEYSKRFHERTFSNYWEELVNAEKENGERYIARIGNVEFLVPFAPLHRNEVLAILRDKSNFIEYSEQDINDLALGIAKILTCYRFKGISSFNFVLNSAPLGSKAEYYWSNLTIISRPNVRANYLNDDSWFGSKLLLENVTAEPPEAFAAVLREIFAR
jgi:galactose-1-phosphate uridylyltransferase